MDDNRIINLDHVNITETLQYLGYGSNEPDSNVEELLLLCEKELLTSAQPEFVYKIFDIDTSYKLKNCDFELQGKDIREHLQGCDRVIFLSVTLSANVDKLIKLKQVREMAQAVIIDAMACALVEQACDKALEYIAQKLPNKFFTERFGLGYGDFPIENQKKFLDILEAQKKIGVCVLDSYLLTPSKSVTCIIGISDKEVAKVSYKCNNCNLNDKCRFRRIGVSCGNTGNIKR